MAISRLFDLATSVLRAPHFVGEMPSVPFCSELRLGGLIQTQAGISLGAEDAAGGGDPNLMAGKNCMRDPACVWCLWLHFACVPSFLWELAAGFWPAAISDCPACWADWLLPRTFYHS